LRQTLSVLHVIKLLPLHSLSTCLRLSSPNLTSHHWRTRLAAIQLRRLCFVRDLSSDVCYSLIVCFLSFLLCSCLLCLFQTVCIGITAHLRYNSFDGFHSWCRAAWLSGEHFPVLVDNEDTASGLVAFFLQPNGTDECLLWIAEKWIRQALLRLERRVCFRAVIAEPIYGEARGSERLVGVAEEADLSCACFGLVIAKGRQYVDNTYSLACSPWGR